jgi:hypothetical protein
VLLAVLAVLVLMVTVLAALSKLSLRRALAAADGQVRLQQRLGADSIEAALLPKAGGVFALLEEQSDQSWVETETILPIPTQLRGVVTIGGVTFDVILADEDSKLNLNQVYHLTGMQKTETTAGRLVGPRAEKSLRLLPAVRPMTKELLETSSADESGDGPAGSLADLADDASDPLPVEIPRAFRSWGEVFDLSALNAGFGNDAALPNVTSNLTCWGGGGLNLRRASDASIQAAAACVLSEAGARRLVSRYRENPVLSLEILVQQEVKIESDRLRLRRMLAETSTHFSLWIDASATARRSTRTFSVMRRTEDSIMINERFAF